LFGSLYLLGLLVRLEFPLEYMSIASFISFDVFKISFVNTSLLVLPFSKTEIGLTPPVFGEGTAVFGN
jgi:hypothetical protein